MNIIGADLTQWTAFYTQGAEPETLLPELLSLLDPDDPIWISLASLEKIIDQITALRQKKGGPGDPLTPLWGIPFVLKDNIDAQGWETTAGCADFAFRPEKNATVTGLLQEAGAILIGKTNMDQFATGLVGTRSPYGPVPNPYNPLFISGGSSSGSAAAVAKGFVPFSLGTDTAGSGRVPAAFCNIVGFKPTRGALSNKGVFPACRTLDCVSLFSRNSGDAQRISKILEAYDPEDPYSRPRPHPSSPGSKIKIAYPETLHPSCTEETASLFKKSLEKLGEHYTLQGMDFGLLHHLALLLYQGPWLAERYVALKDFLPLHGERMNPTVRDIIEKGKDYSACEYFEADYKRQEILQKLNTLMENVDLLIMPTTPDIFTLEQIKEDPIALNSVLGVYTNFMNLADLAALALPAGFRPNGLPFGITLASRAWDEEKLWSVGENWNILLGGRE